MATAVEIERFFGGVIGSSHTTDNNNNGDGSSIKFESTDIVLLSGPAHSGKTSLLFQYGYTYAKQGYTVLFICNKRKFQQNLPYFPIGFLKDDFFLKRLKIKFIDNDSELRNYLFDFPSLSFLPDLILIDDISHYFGSMVYERNAALGKTFAFLKETLQYIKNQKILKYNNITNNNTDNNNRNNNNQDNKLLDCKIIVTDISLITNEATNNITSTNNTTPDQSQQQQQQQQQQQSQQIQQLQINSKTTFISSNHPKHLYIVQRWVNLVLNINEIVSINNSPVPTSATTSTSLPTTHTSNVPSNKKYILSVLRFKDSNTNTNNMLKEYLLSYTVKFQGSNNQNNSFTLDSIQIPKHINYNNNEANIEENSPTQPLM